MPRIIKDCIYGHIEVPDLCAVYMDQPEFQRLRRIKQLGNVYRVYPSATHTRFEHSLGVMHLAGRMCQVLGLTDERITALVQLAGLYHDVGHMPYSHLFDRALLRMQELGVESATDDTDHEVRSIHIFRTVSDRLQLLHDDEIGFVCDCIRGQPTMDSPLVYPKWVCQIVHSEVDVDKLDYLCRDAYHTGMPSFQSNYIILNVFIKDDQLVFRRKAEEDIKSMFQTRERMHHLVYQHPVSLQYDSLYVCMLLALTGEVNLRQYTCDYTLDTLLLTHEKTRETYHKLECRIKNHRQLCLNPHIGHHECEKHIPASGTIADVRWL